jgi:predicted esterase
MKNLGFLGFGGIFLLGLCACAIVLPEPVKGGIKPGTKIGEMIVEQGVPTLPYPYIWKFCEYMPDEQEPISFTSNCTVPLISGVDIGFGWLAKESKFASNWEAMAWQLYIDGYQIDLESFDWYETDYPVHGEDNKERRWIIHLKNLTPGKHTLQLSWKTDLAIDDGLHVYHPGTYETWVNFTVSEKALYPIFSSTTTIGLHTYTSEKAKLDFLLYLPGDYGINPQQEWPMIVYLHGADLRGATLELLMEEPLPKKLQNEADFPFIVISPLGDGGYQFWAEDELINSIFTVLEEVRTVYSINPKQIYLTGTDMGGNGVWAIGLRYPEYFAALAPIAGYFDYPFTVPKNICDLKEVPVWAFHGKRDQFVPVEAEKGLVDALSACGGSAQITVSSDMKADVPVKVYENPELYEWLLSQSRNNP